jgi:hypothetical protein
VRRAPSVALVGGVPLRGTSPLVRAWGAVSDTPPSARARGRYRSHPLAMPHAPRNAPIYGGIGHR